MAMNLETQHPMTIAGGGFTIITKVLKEGYIQMIIDFTTIEQGELSSYHNDCDCKLLPVSSVS